MNRTNMKKVCCVLFFAVAAAGCSTFRKTTSVCHVRTEDRTQIDSSRLSDGRAVLAGASVLNTIEELRNGKDIRIVFYDTSKPADPQTGRPPVLAEAMVRDSTSMKRTQDRRDTVIREETVREESTDRIRYDVKIESETEEQVENKNRPVWIYAVSLGIALLIWLMVFRFKI